MKRDATYIGEIGSYMSIFLGHPTGSGLITYKMIKDDIPLDYTYYNSQFNMPELTEDHAGRYAFEAENSIGIDRSGTITLIVTPPVNEALELPNEPKVVGRNKTRDSRYIIYQTETSWDGEDAVEMHAENERLGFGIPYSSEDRLFRFRWKANIGQASTFSYIFANQDPVILENQSEWNEETVFIPAFGSMDLSIEPNDEECYVWLDAFEFIDEPTLVQDIQYSLPKVDSPMTIRAKFFGTDLEYEWLKDGKLIEGENADTLLISNFSNESAGAYQVRAKNSNGFSESSIANIELNPPSQLVTDNFRWAENTEKYVYISPGGGLGSEYLSIDLSDIQKGELVAELTGPGYVRIQHDLTSTYASYFLDDERSWESPWHPDPSSIYLPSGIHKFRAEFASRGLNKVGKVFTFSYEQSPKAALRPSQFADFDQDFVPQASIEGIEPLTIEWYKDGQLIDRKTNQLSGVHSPYYRETGPNDLGTYSVKVIDVNQRYSISKEVDFFSNVFLNAIIDIPEIRHSAVSTFGKQYKVDKDSAINGESALLFAGKWEDDSERRISFEVAANYLSFWVKSTGFEPGSQLRYDFDGEIKYIPVNEEWQQVTLGTDGSSINLLIEGDTEDSKLWIDSASYDHRPYFVSHPKNVSTYLGGTVTLSAFANSRPSTQQPIRWRKDGVYITDATLESLVLLNIDESALGTYDAVAVSSDESTSSVSEAAEVTLASQSLRKAIGFPGARVATHGDAFWIVDSKDSFEGPTSLISGYLKNGEESTIEIEVDGPAAWGIYLKEYSIDDSETGGSDRVWFFNPAGYSPAGESSIFRYTTYRDSNQSSVPYARVDGVEIARLGVANYERWIDKELFGLDRAFSGDPKARSSDPDGDNIPNWVEFALSLDPSSFDTLPTFGITRSDESSRIASVHFVASRSDEYALVYEASYDLETWFAIRPRVEVVHSTPDVDEIKVLFELEGKEAPAYFVRWSIMYDSKSNDGAF